MTHDDEEAFVALAARVLGIPVAEVTVCTDLDSAGRWTSLQRLQLMAQVEDTFQVKFAPREMLTIRTVTELWDLTRRKRITF